MTDNQYAFVQGYKLAAETGNELSYRETETAFPGLAHEQLEYVCHGSVDGAVGDLWRVNLILAGCWQQPKHGGRNDA